MGKFVSLNKDLVRIVDVAYVKFPRVEKKKDGQYYSTLLWGGNGLPYSGVQYVIPEATHTVVRKFLWFRWRVLVDRPWARIRPWRKTSGHADAVKHYNEIKETLEGQF